MGCGAVLILAAYRTLRVRLWMVLEVLPTVQSKSSGSVHGAHSASGLVGRFSTRQAGTLLSVQTIVSLQLDVRWILSFFFSHFFLLQSAYCGSS